MAGKQDKKESKDDNENIVVIEEPEAEEKISGEIDSSQEEEKEKLQNKIPIKKRGNDNQKRINELWLKRKEAEDNAKRESERAQKAAAKNTEYERITASALEENINTKRELLTDRLIRANEAGDAKKAGEITAELSKIEAQSAQIERYKLENQISPQQQKQQSEVQTKEISPEEMYDNLSPAGKKWMDDNKDWYDESGENHDPERVSDVTYYAQKLEQEYVGSGRSSEIGTRAYFRKIDDYIKKNWNDDVPDEKDEDESVVQPKKNYAAPVGNRALPNSAPGARKEYKITQAEKEMALSLDRKSKDGKSLSDNDKIKHFINLREGTPQSGPISMSTIKRGA